MKNEGGSLLHFHFILHSSFFIFHYSSLLVRSALNAPVPRSPTLAVPVILSPSILPATLIVTFLPPSTSVHENFTSAPLIVPRTWNSPNSDVVWPLMRGPSCCR